MNITFWKKENMQTCSYQRWIKPPFKRFKFQKRWKDVVCILLLLFINIKIFKVFIFFREGDVVIFWKQTISKHLNVIVCILLLFFCGSCSELFFSYKRTKSNNRKGWQVLLRSLAYSCWSCGLFSYRITFSTSGLLRSWKWIILAVFKWVFTWFPETVLRGAPPPGVPRRSTIDPLGCDREKKRKKER